MILLHQHLLPHESRQQLFADLDFAGTAGAGAVCSHGLKFRRSANGFDRFKVETQPRQRPDDKGTCR